LATEQGVVIRTGIKTAWIKTVQSSSCKSCSERKSCNSTGGAEVEIEAINAVKAKPGDLVIISVDPASLLKATVLLYMFPIACLVVGALGGQKLAFMFNWDESTAAAIFGFSAFFLSMLFVRYKSNRMVKQDRYRAHVLRILGPYVPDS
jgi:sigma-E factor negative regulatory protein RseC